MARTCISCGSSEPYPIAEPNFVQVCTGRNPATGSLEYQGVEAGYIPVCKNCGYSGNTLFEEHLIDTLGLESITFSSGKENV